MFLNMGSKVGFIRLGVGEEGSEKGSVGGGGRFVVGVVMGGWGGCR